MEDLEQFGCGAVGATQQTMQSKDLLKQSFCCAGGDRELALKHLDLGRGIHNSVKVHGMTILTLRSLYSAYHSLQMKKQGSSRDKFARLKGKFPSPKSVSLHSVLCSHRYAWTDRVQQQLYWNSLTIILPRTWRGDCTVWYFCSSLLSTEAYSPQGLKKDL